MELTTSVPPTTEADACAVWIEVDGRQRYLFETDKLAEILGASRVIAETVTKAGEYFPTCHVFQPVSGEIGVWTTIDNKVALVNGALKLGEWLQNCGVSHSCGYIETSRRHFCETDGDLAKEVVQRLKAVTGAARHSRDAIDAGPSCALFAPCGLHGWEYANRWDPQEKRELRRQLSGSRAKAKLDAWKAYKTEFYDKELNAVLQGHLGDKVRILRSITFSDLILDDQDEREDQFIAFICADGDGVGRALQGVKWNTDSGDGLKPWQRNQRFALQLDDALRKAYRLALIDVVSPDAGIAQINELADLVDPVLHAPVLPQLMGGDDLWMVMHRDVALHFAVAFSNRFSELVSSPEAALVRRVSGPRPLTLSLGVAFAKAGYPAHAMVAAAEGLLKSAKRLRKGLETGRPEPNEGCVDWHWIESSVSESVSDARLAALQYEHPFGDGEQRELRTFRLTTRPWTVSETAAAITATREFEHIARRKREQLEPILRLGLEVSRLRWEGWFKSLERKERAHLATVRELLKPIIELESPLGEQPEVDFWPWSQSTGTDRDHWFTTPFLDLLALSDPLDSPEPAAAGGETL